VQIDANIVVNESSTDDTGLHEGRSSVRLPKVDGKTAHVVTEEQTASSSGNDEPPDESGGPVLTFGANDGFVNLETRLAEVLEHGLVVLVEVDVAGRVGAGGRGPSGGLEEGSGS
jgi:hypothetical protein